MHFIVRTKTYKCSSMHQTLTLKTTSNITDSKRTKKKPTIELPKNIGIINRNTTISYLSIGTLLEKIHNDLGTNIIHYIDS